MAMPLLTSLKDAAGGALSFANDTIHWVALKPVKKAWAWLQQRRSGERRVEYLVELCAFLLLLGGAVFAIWQWYAARVSNTIARTSNKLALKQICTSAVSLQRRWRKPLLLMLTVRVEPGH